jgi:hypothetical protein
MKNMNEFTRFSESDFISLPKKEEASLAAAEKQSEAGMSEKRQALEAARREIAEAAKHLSEIIGMEVRPPGIVIRNKFDNPEHTAEFFRWSPNFIMLSLEKNCEGVGHELYHRQRLVAGADKKDSNTVILFELELKNDNAAESILAEYLAWMTCRALDEGGANLFESSFKQKLDSNKGNFIARCFNFNFETARLTLEEMRKMHEEINKPEWIGIDGHKNLGKYAEGFLNSCSAGEAYFDCVGDVLVLSLYYVNNKDINKTIKELFENPSQDTLDHIVRGIEEDRKVKRLSAMIREDKEEIMKLERQQCFTEISKGPLKSERRLN